MLRFMYRSLLRLHPAGFRRRFGEEMLSIFDHAEDRRGAAKLTADAFLSLGRQWALRSEYWEEKETEPLPCSTDGVPIFYTLHSSTPRASALINGALVALVVFWGVCFVLRYNWTHPIYLRFAGVHIEFRNDMQPVVSPFVAPRLERPNSAERPTETQIESSPAVTPRTPETTLGEQFARQTDQARFYFLHGNYAAATEHYRMALQMRPNDPDATFGLAESLAKSGRTAEAQKAYRAYLESAPYGLFAEEAKAALRRLEHSVPR